jgi:hypothetical protein
METGWFPQLFGFDRTMVVVHKISNRSFVGIVYGRVPARDQIIDQRGFAASHIDNGWGVVIWWEPSLALRRAASTCG